MTDNIKQHDFLLKSIPAAIKSVERQAEDMLRQRGASDECIYDILISMDEAFSNIIRHSFQGSPDEQIRVIISLNSNLFRVVFIDNAKPFTLPAEPPKLGRALIEEKYPGLGIHLMKSLMDSVEYMREGNENRLTIEKKVTPKEGT